MGRQLHGGQPQLRQQQVRSRHIRSAPSNLIQPTPTAQPPLHNALHDALEDAVGVQSEDVLVSPLIKAIACPLEGPGHDAGQQLARRWDEAAHMRWWHTGCCVVGVGHEELHHQLVQGLLQTAAVTTSQALMELVTACCCSPHFLQLQLQHFAHSLILHPT